MSIRRMSPARSSIVGVGRNSRPTPRSIASRLTPEARKLSPSRRRPISGEFGLTRARTSRSASS
jgi:hypothetical protein